MLLAATWQIVVRPTMERVREALFNQAGGVARIQDRIDTSHRLLKVTAMHLFEDRSVRHLDLFTGRFAVSEEPHMHRFRSALRSGRVCKLAECVQGPAPWESKG